MFVNSVDVVRTVVFVMLVIISDLKKSDLMKQHEILKQSWVWKKTVEKFVEGHISGYSLNVCAGLSPLGDVKIDLDPKHESVMKADMNNLPFENCTFDTVISDPYWKMGFYKRPRPFFECVRVCKVGGKIIYNAYWIPDSKSVDLVVTYIRQDKPFTNTSIISVFRKHTAEFDNYRGKS